MSWLLIALVGAVANAVVAEIFGWLPWLAARIVSGAARLMPASARERYRDEWLGELDTLPGRGISSILFAVQILAFAPIVRLEFAGQRPALRLQFGIKHVFDRALALLLLVFLAPLLLTVALAIKGSSRGPVLYRQRRIDPGGRVLRLYRFRLTRAAMPRGREPMGTFTDYLLLHGSLAAEGLGKDQRTAIGRFLHFTNLDGLPELINVLRGEMSLVGPRPELPELADLFPNRSIRKYNRGHVKAGITGWAQVLSLRDRATLAEHVALDNYYADHWSLFLDLKILAWTFIAGLRAK